MALDCNTVSEPEFLDSQKFGEKTAVDCNTVSEPEFLDSQV